MSPDDVLARAFLDRVSRRRFVRRSAAVAGGLAAFGALAPATASAHGPKHGKKDGDPSPIPGGFLIGADGSFTPVPADPTIHVLPPVVGFEMSTITDFDGVVGAADIQGTARDNQGGEYWFDCDMRFMKGRFVDTDGRKREDVFGFVWIDLFQGPRGDPEHSTQVHDFEPGIEDSGLFWTIPVSKSSVDVQKHKGTARFRADGLELDDYFNFGNAISPDPDSVPAKVSFDVRWQGGGDESSIDDSTFGFKGDFVTGPATISFRARSEHSDVEYRSDKDGQTNPGPPGVGQEQNGVFY